MYTLTIKETNFLICNRLKSYRTNYKPRDKELTAYILHFNCDVGISYSLKLFYEWENFQDIVKRLVKFETKFSCLTIYIPSTEEKSSITKFTQANTHFISFLKIITHRQCGTKANCDKDKAANFVKDKNSIFLFFFLNNNL